MTPPENNLPPLIQQMLAREFYPHVTVDPIQLIQTHISFVLLTGPFAYKIKKSVKLPFLDFSTLELRQHFCLLELQLNRRGAPGLYLDLAPITNQNGRYRLDGPGPAVEYAVQMRQFRQEALYSDMLEQGHLGYWQIMELARAMADYHAGAETNAAIAAFGAPDRIREVFENNYTQTRQFIGTLQTAEYFEQTKAFTDRFFDNHDKILRDRAASGRVRACHGDLHLGNICQWDGKVQLFDCIEFNESFRNVDVMHDLAFAAMDLEAGGRADLSITLINNYCEWSGDWEGLELLPLYLCRQAYVRAKVNSLLTEEAEAAPDQKQSAADRAKQHYELAWRYGQPRKGSLTIVCGLSGSGKSTLAYKRSAQDGSVVIRSDAVRKHLAKIRLDQRGGAAVYSPEMTIRTYARLGELGVNLASQGFGVILDAKFDRRAERTSLLALAGKFGLPVRIVFCDAPLEVRRQRAKDRRGDVSDADAGIVEQQGEFERFDESERPLVQIVDTSSADAKVS